MNSLNLSAIKRPLSGLISFVGRFHYIIFICLLALGFAYTVLSINSIVSAPSDKSYRDDAEAKTISSDFDQETILKLRKLKFSDQFVDISFPEGRTNPFSE